MAEQSYVNSKKRRGLRTHLCREPVLRMMGEDVRLWILTDWRRFVKKVQHPVAERSAQTQYYQFIDQSLWDHCVEWQAEIQEQLPDI